MAKQSFNELINGDTPVLVDFYADWCGPCQTMAPVIADVADKLGDKLKVIKIDTDRNQQVASRFEIQGIPTFILFKKGQAVWRSSGAMPRKQLQDAIMPFLS